MKGLIGKKVSKKDLTLNTIIRNMLLALFVLTVSGCLNKEKFEQSDICKVFFRSNTNQNELLNSYSITQLIELEKCGFQYHPSITFRDKIITSSSNPVPYLLEELRESSDEQWITHIICLIHSSIESKKFESENLNNKDEIMNKVNSSLSQIKNKNAYQRALSCRDGIHIFFETN